MNLIRPMKNISSVHLKQKMNNLTFVDEENIQMIHQDEDNYEDDHNTPNTSSVETSSINYDTTEPTSTLRLRQKVKRDKINALYRHLNVTGNPGLADLNRFMIKKNSKTGNIELLFLDGNNQWQSLTNKQIGEFLGAKTLRDRFGGVNAMKRFLGIETPPLLERSISAATKLKSELPTDFQMESIPLKELSSLTEVIHNKTRQVSQNTSLDMREFLAIKRDLQSIQHLKINRG